MTKKRKNILSRVFFFYVEGFKNMGGWGKQVWLIILIKLFIMFFILRLFFFPNFLRTNFKTKEERSNHVIEELIKIKKSTDTNTTDK